MKARSITLCLSCCLLQGCYNYYVNHKPRPAPVPLAPDAWPERDADVLRAIYEATPATITGLLAAAMTSAASLAASFSASASLVSSLECRT